MPTLADFLKADDLDDLLKIRYNLEPLDEKDAECILSIICEWKDGQAVSNLLYYPKLIPEAQRWAAIERALDPEGQGYYIIAALVGLQSIDPAAVPESYRHRWVTFMLVLIGDDLGIYSRRASVTIYQWLPENETEQLIRLYPAPDSLVSKNIVAFALRRWGHLSRTEFRARLQRAGVGFWRRRAFLKRYDRFRKMDVSFLDCPLLCALPDYKPFLAAQRIANC